jgi:hypothetical protein
MHRIVRVVSFEAPSRAAMIAGSMFLSGCLAAGLLVCSDRAWADQPTDVSRVEEDWELVVGEPSADDTAPQIVNFISPTARTDAEYGILELNHSTQPEYLDGGIQFQRWFGDFERVYRTPHTQNRLSTPGEVVTYTMSMKIENGQLEFGVKNGTSQTWGTFGGDSEQWRSSTTSPYANLDHYSPRVSTKNSRIGYAANRVSSFTLKAVRYYRGDELLYTDSTAQVVHQTTSAESSGE